MCETTLRVMIYSQTCFKHTKSELGFTKYPLNGQSQLFGSFLIKLKIKIKTLVVMLLIYLFTKGEKNLQKFQEQKECDEAHTYKIKYCLSGNLKV